MRRLSKDAKRNIVSYLLTIFIYVPLIAWWIIDSSILIASPSKAKVKEITLDLNSFQSNPPEPTEEDRDNTDREIEKRKERPKETIEPPKPKPTPILSPIPKPIIKEVIKKRPIDIPKSKKVEPKKQKVKTKKPKKPKTKSQKVKKSKSKHRAKRYSRNSGQKRGKSTIKSSTVGKSQFIRRLKSKIERNKKYPRIAQKRGMQGSIKVRFTITKAGAPTNIVTRGPRVFSSATKSAIKRSFPISTKGVSLPMDITLTINYRLKR